MKNQKQGVLPNIEAAYKGDLTFWELIVLGKLFPSIKISDSDFCEYRLPLNDFYATQTIENEMISLNILKAASKLLERKVKWTYIDNNEQIHEYQTTLLTSTDCLTHNNTSTLEVNIHPKFKSLLLFLKSDAKSFDLLQLPFLKMNTSHRLYLILLQNINRNLNSFSISLEKLKALLDVSDKYSLYANFKIKILEEAQKRLLQDADIRFDFGEIKTGKRVTALRFRIDHNPLLSFFDTDIEEAVVMPVFENMEQSKADISPTENKEEATFDKDLIEQIIKKFGVTQRMIKKLSEDFSQQSLRQAMLLTEKAIERGSIKGSAAGFFVEAVRQNYQAIEEDEQEKRQAEVRQKAEKLAKMEAEQRQQRENLKKQEFEQERDAILEELSKDNALQQTIAERIRYSIFHASYDVSKSFNENLENPSFLAAVLNFYRIIKT